MKRQMRAARVRHRLEPRARDLRARVLPLEPVAVPADAREGYRLPQDGHRQLGPGRPDRARQRAGDRRPRLAHGRARREARDPDVLPAHHRLRGGTARLARWAARLAGTRQAHAIELDRPLRGSRARVRGRGRPRAAARLHDATRHALRRHLHGGRGGASARAARRAIGPGPAGLHRRMPAQRRHRGGARDDGEARHAARRRRDPSAHRRAHAGLGRELRAHGLWHRRGHGGAGARPARLGVRATLRAAHPPGHRARGRPPGRPRRGRVRRARPAHQFRVASTGSISTRRSTRSRSPSRRPAAASAA